MHSDLNNGSKTWLEYYIFLYTISKGYSSECAPIVLFAPFSDSASAPNRLRNRTTIIDKAITSPLHGVMSSET